MFRRDKPRTSSSPLFHDGADPQQKRNDFILFVYKDRRVVGTRHDCYEVGAEALGTKVGPRDSPFC